MRNIREIQNNQEDAALVLRTRAGEHEAFQELLLRYSGSVQRLCIRLLTSPQEAQDIVQEAALQAFLGLGRLQEPARFGAWFHAIAANLARSSLRRRREISSSQLFHEELQGRVLWNANPLSLEEVQETGEIHDAIIAALQELSAVNRQAVIGFYLEGYSYSELAQLLGVSVSTVKGRLFQGRQHLKNTLQPFVAAFRQPLPQHRTEQQQAVELLLSQLLHESILRTVLLLNPNGVLVAHQGPDAHEKLLRLSRQLGKDLASQAELANEAKLRPQPGRQPQKVILAVGSMHTIMQELPPEIGGILMHKVYQGWSLVVILANSNPHNLRKAVKQELHYKIQAIAEILKQAVRS